MNHRVTPSIFDAEAEQAVLGAILLEPAAFARAKSLLTPELFYADRNRLLFGAMADLSSRGVKIDPLTLADELKRRGNLEAVGGIEYVATLIDVVPTAGHIEDHAAIVADKAQRRRIASAAQQLLDATQNGTPLESLERDLAALLAGTRPRSTKASIQWRTLRDLLSEPQASSTPMPVISRCAFRGRVTLFAAREKDGKSTFAAAGVAALTQGRAFLGDQLAAGTALWVVAEEHPHDLAQRAKNFETNEDRLYVMGCPTPETFFADLRSAAETLKPTLLVIDTLATATGGMVDDAHSAASWTPIMTAFTSIARDLDVAVLLLAHSRKSDGAYRDSTAIGAGVDVILEMSTPVDDTTCRTIKARGRWAMSPFTVRYVGNGFELSGGELSRDARMLLHIKKEPGMSKQRLRDVVGGRASDVDAAQRELLQRGAIVERPGPRGSKRLFAAEDAPQELTPYDGQNPDEVRDEVATPSADLVPTLSPNDLAADEVARSSRTQTLGGETGRGEHRCPEGHALIAGLCPECDREQFNAALDAEAASVKGAAA